jgi:uncharacterized protein
MIKRVYQDLGSYLHPKEALILYGPRRVGKTTLLEGYLANSGLKYRLESGDNVVASDILSSQDLPRIREYLQGFDLLAIDEAQSIPNIGASIKLIIDQIPGIKVIATGSSSFDLANQVGEPLTDRKTTLTLYPVSQLELLNDGINAFDLKQRLEEFLIFGSYPKILMAKERSEKIRLIEELVGSYILKDILALDRIKASRTIFDLLRLLAFQIGSEVSLGELSRQLGIDGKTVSRYLDLLEKSFIIVRLGGFSRNLRSEVTDKAKYYFLDNGVRNGVVSQFNNLNVRNDVGQLWENFIFSERIKKLAYQRMYGQSYFWRTYEQQEIDLIEERDGELFAYEFKWSVKHKEVKPPKAWAEAYPEYKSFEVIDPENYLDFVGS